MEIAEARRKEADGFTKILWLLARPILQEYDASTVELRVNPAEFGNLAARHNLVEIVEACWMEADAFIFNRPTASVSS